MEFLQVADKSKLPVDDSGMTLNTSSGSMQDAFLEYDDDEISCTPQQQSIAPPLFTPDSSGHAFDFTQSVSVIPLDNVVYKIGDLGHAIPLNGTVSVDDGDTRYMPLEFLDNV